MEEFEKIGGVAARSPAQIAEEADIIFSCLPGGDSLDQVVTGPDGLIISARKGQIIAELGSHPLPAKERQVARSQRKARSFSTAKSAVRPAW